MLFQERCKREARILRRLLCDDVISACLVVISPRCLYFQEAPAIYTLLSNPKGRIHCQKPLSVLLRTSKRMQEDTFENDVKTCKPSHLRVCLS